MKPDLSKLKYRIGDRVLYQGKPTEIIAYCISGNPEYTIRLYSPRSHRGNTCSIDELGNPLEFDEGSAFYVLEDNLTLIKSNTMTLNDLKNFDIITTRDKKQWFVYKDIFINIYDSTRILFKSSFNSNMQHDTWHCQDIMKVERLDVEFRCLYLDAAMKRYLGKTSDFRYETVYERVETTELTMQQIADKFGVPVETLKIKK